MTTDYAITPIKIMIVQIISCFNLMQIKLYFSRFFFLFYFISDIDPSFQRCAMYYVLAVIFFKQFFFAKCRHTCIYDNVHVVETVFCHGAYIILQSRLETRVMPGKMQILVLRVSPIYQQL